MNTFNKDSCVKLISTLLHTFARRASNRNYVEFFVREILNADKDINFAFKRLPLPSDHPDYEQSYLEEAIASVLDEFLKAGLLHQNTVKDITDFAIKKEADWLLYSVLDNLEKKKNDSNFDSFSKDIIEIIDNYNPYIRKSHIENLFIKWF